MESQHALAVRRIARATMAAMAVMIATAATSAAAQAPTDTSRSYRPPTIALVLPPSGGSVPADRPVVVFRFAQGEPEDPIDATSLRVWVDGEERSRSFQLANGEAWGSLSSRLASGDSAARGASATVLAPGVHLLVARLCSTRGVCGEARAPVTVLPAAEATVPTAAGAASDSTRASATGPGAAAGKSFGRKVLDALLGGARKLLAP